MTITPGALTASVGVTAGANINGHVRWLQSRRRRA